MGVQEEKSKKRQRYKDVQGAVLATIAVGGVLAAAVMVPGLLVALGKLHKQGLLPELIKEESIKRSFARMRKKGFIAVKNNRYVLTSEGELALVRRGGLQFINKKPRRWDGKWRVLVFDLPARRRADRDRLRIILRSNGFALLQKSVWVYPHPCDDFVAMLKTKLKIRPFVLYMIVDNIENQEYLEREFNLAHC